MYKFSEVSHVVARSLNGVIGVDNTIPWRSKRDMQHFRKLTMGKICIVGRKTFESFPGILKGRTMIIVSRDVGGELSERIRDIPHHYIRGGVEEALEFADNLSMGNGIMVIGGGQIYKETLQYVDKIHLSTIQTTVEGDTFYSLPEDIEDIDVIHYKYAIDGEYTKEEKLFLDQLVRDHGQRVFNTYKYAGTNGYKIGRPSPYGNDWSHLPQSKAKYVVPSRELAVLEYYYAELAKFEKDPETYRRYLSPLMGKDFLCYCSNGTNSTLDGAKYCHGHVLAHMQTLI